MQTVGGIALTRSYYQHALETEGKPEAVEQCQLVISRRAANELKMCPVTTVRARSMLINLHHCLQHISPFQRLQPVQEQLEAGAPELPREAPLLAKLMGPTAIAQFKWSRVPAVVIYGCFVADEAGTKRFSIIISCKEAACMLRVQVPMTCAAVQRWSRLSPVASLCHPACQALTKRSSLHS